MREKRVREYRTFEDDFSVSRHQDYRLPDGYRWERNGVPARILSALLYAVALPFAYLGCKLVLRVRFHNRNLLKDLRKSGGFLYCNHTLTLGDTVLPALGIFPARIRTVVSPANLGIPLIGKLLPYLGALPVPDTLSGLRSLSEAIRHATERKETVVIYPEAHVWDYYTDIRPFPATAFTYPARIPRPVYVMTVTYRKPKHGKRPVTEVFFDGPLAGGNEPRKTAEHLCHEAFSRMKERSKYSNYDYIEYRRVP